METGFSENFLLEVQNFILELWEPVARVEQIYLVGKFVDIGSIGV